MRERRESIEGLPGHTGSGRLLAETATPSSRPAASCASSCCAQGLILNDLYGAQGERPDIGQSSDQ